MSEVVVARFRVLPFDNLGFRMSADLWFGESAGTHFEIYADIVTNLCVENRDLTEWAIGHSRNHRMSIRATAIL